MFKFNKTQRATQQNYVKQRKLSSFEAMLCDVTTVEKGADKFWEGHNCCWMLVVGV